MSLEIAETRPFHSRLILPHTTSRITNARVLDPEFVPNDVVQRDAEINLLSSALRPVTDGDPADPAFLHGSSGTGNICIA